MGCMLPGKSVEEQSLASVKEGCTLDGCGCHRCSSGQYASLAGCSLGVHVHLQPCQMFSRKAVSEGRGKHKYFVTFLGYFSEPGVSRGQLCIEWRPSHLHPRSSSLIPILLFVVRGLKGDAGGETEAGHFLEVTPIFIRGLHPMWEGHKDSQAMWHRMPWSQIGTGPRKCSVLQESRVSQSKDPYLLPGVGKIWKESDQSLDVVYSKVEPACAQVLFWAHSHCVRTPIGASS